MYVLITEAVDGIHFIAQAETEKEIRKEMAEFTGVDEKIFGAEYWSFVGSPQNTKYFYTDDLEGTKEQIKEMNEILYGW